MTHKQLQVIGLGEVLWDMLPSGRQLGGAPANFAYHACSLGADGRIISRIGPDHAGREILTRLTELGIPTDCIQTDPRAPTSTVSVEVSATGQPTYTIHEQVAWDYLTPDDSATRAVQRCDAICFGTLAQRNQPSRNAIHDLLRLAPASSLRVLDINLRQHYFSRQLIEQSLALANILKINDHELSLLAEMFSLVDDIPSALAQLANQFDLRLVACTRGANGSLLFSKGRWSDHPGHPASVIDTVGAGDSFTAAMIVGLLAGWDLDKVNDQASRVASYVASCSGGTPSLPANLTHAFVTS